MNTVAITIDILILMVCAIGLYVAYRLWCLLGKKGITSWFMLGWCYAAGLRTISLLSDTRVITWDMSRQLAFPMYVFFVLGLWGLHWQVRVKLVGNGEHTLRRLWRWILNRQPS